MKEKDYTALNISLIVILLLAWVSAIVHNGIIGGMFCIIFSIVSVKITSKIISKIKKGSQESS